MDLNDSAEEARFRARSRSWLEAHVPPEQPDAGPRRGWRSEELRNWSKALHEAGYAGLTWPREHGGQGLTAAFQAVFAEESARAQAPDHANVIGLNMVGPTLIQHGTPEQQGHYLPRILDGRALFCQGFSEPGAGSDLAAASAAAQEVPGGYVVTGEKVWSSYAHVADHCLLLARTGPAGGRHQGLTCFVLDLGTPGVTVRPLRQITGDSDFSQILLDGVRIPREQVVGAPGAGWTVAMGTLAHERGTFGIALVARMSVQLSRLIRTVHELGLSGDTTVRREIAALSVELEGLRFTGYRSLAAVVRTGQPGPESSVLKLRWSLAHQRLTALALRVQGPQAVLSGGDAWWGGFWQHQFLRSRANTIEGGTSEILRSIIAERVLSLPRAR